MARRHDGDMELARHSALPNPDDARRALPLAVASLGAGVAGEARVLADELTPLLRHKRLRGRSLDEAQFHIRRIVNSPRYHDSWHMHMTRILSGFYDAGDPNGSSPAGVYHTLSPVGTAIGYNREILEIPAEETRILLGKLYKGLMLLAEQAATSMQPPPVLPVHHPPSFARLRVDVVAQSVAEQIAAAIELGVDEYHQSQAGLWPDYGSRHSWLPLKDRSLFRVLDSPLNAFVTTEVGQRYHAATWGFHFVEDLAGAFIDGSELSADPMYRKIADTAHPQIRACYIAIAVNYLAEVYRLMPKYAQDSGQGTPRDQVTVFGNVGAINSTVSQSTVTAAGSAEGGNLTLNARDAELADAVRALRAAIQREPTFSEDKRAQLLDNVADITDAADTHEPRKINRAKAAIDAITAAAGTSVHLLQAVDACRELIDKLFSR